MTDHFLNEILLTSDLCNPEKLDAVLSTRYDLEDIFEKLLKTSERLQTKKIN